MAKNNGHYAEYAEIALGVGMWYYASDIANYFSVGEGQVMFFAAITIIWGGIALLFRH